MLQPREGIFGRDRTDGLLSLDESAVPARALIMTLALNLHKAALMFNPPAYLKDLRTQMDNPRPGDLVLELSTAYSLMRGRFAIEGLGFLIETRTEWWHLNEEWEECKDDYAPDPRPTDTVSYVQYGPNAADVVRWSNHTLIGVPTSILT